jgi:tRNA(fMet)-specific endonuclease VapC
MKYLLDTNAVIHLMNEEDAIASRIFAHSPSDFVVSGFTEAELLFGVERSGELHRATNQLSIQLALASFKIVYQDHSISSIYGKIKAHLVSKKAFREQNEIDLFIAATAIAHDLVLITQNSKDFKHIPHLKFENWS